MSRFNHMLLGKRRRSARSCRDALRFDSRCANTLAGDRAFAGGACGPVAGPRSSPRDPTLEPGVHPIASGARANASSVHPFACRVPSLGSQDGAIGLQEYSLDLPARGHSSVAGLPSMSLVGDTLGTACYWLLAIRYSPAPNANDPPVPSRRVVALPIANSQ
jgi:hypothetical protein